MQEYKIEHILKIIPGFVLALNLLVSPNLALAQLQHFTANEQAEVSIGNPPERDCPSGWPTTGNITQGPEGATSHADNVFGGYEAIDIGTPISTPVYATVAGKVVESFTNGSINDQRIGIEVTACDNLSIVYYWHLSARSVNVDDNVTFGQQIGASGSAGSGPHLHYQFNGVGIRSFRMEEPNIPQSPASRSCDGIPACNVHIASAP